VDVLAPEGYGEIIGGSQRVSSFELLNAASSSTTCPRKPSSGTRSAPLRQRPPLGFGMGIERADRLDLRPGPRPRNHPLRPHLHRIYP